MTTLGDLEAKARAATPGPWRSGRSDMRSFDANTGEQFKNIYGPNFEPELHRGSKVAIEVAKAVGDAAIEDAAFIAAANPATVLALVETVRAASDMATLLRGHDYGEHDRGGKLLAAFDAALAKLEKGPVPT